MYLSIGYAQCKIDLKVEQVDKESSTSPSSVLSLGHSKSALSSLRESSQQEARQHSPTVVSFCHCGRALTVAKDAYVQETASVVGVVPNHASRIAILEQEVAEKTCQLVVKEAESLQQRDYIFTLSNKLAASKDECNEMHHCYRAAAAHRDDPGLHDNVWYERSVLKKQLCNIERQKKEIAMIENGSFGTSDNEIQTAFDLESHIAGACTVLNVVDCPFPAAPARGSQRALIESWSLKCSALRVEQLLSYALQNEISAYDVVRSLSAAGLCALTLESSFPDFMASESPLLDQYRHHVLVRGMHPRPSLCD